MSRHRHSMETEAGQGGEAGMERWLLTYADMITLLLALFIVLFAISTISQQKFQSLALGLKQTFDPNPGVLPASNGLLDHTSLVPTAGIHQTQAPQTIAALSATSQTLPTPSVQPLPATAQSNLTSIEAKINHALAAKGLSGAVSTSLQARGLVVKILADKVFFATDSALLGPLGDEVVDTIASVVVSDPNAIDVEGYTDNQPITGGPYTSNEELSAVRAVNVVLRLYRKDGVAQDRLAATGFGQSHPEAPNNSPANMALNRRIDVVVLAPGQAQS